MAKQNKQTSEKINGIDTAMRNMISALINEIDANVPESEQEGVRAAVGHICERIELLLDRVERWT